ncbi:LysR family transcriptional regulator [Symbioplanes lichenis]|uniref:LysR family transcriptional regulator n=1 Tax=Symbioplanes lichenis TaxID=1629072 RepID=UPI00273819D5|nr:LysR family transcriptional regulator [Actinoplanes lichenis]
MLDASRLRLLHDLSRLGTIAAVARLRTYTPSAVSQQLAALEREAGAALLTRTGRTVTLTAAGRALAGHAATVLAALDEAEAALAALREGLTGPLRIGAYPSAVRTLLPAALVDLARDHPGLDLTVTELDPVAVPAALADRTLDVGLIQDYDVAPGIPDPALGSRPLLDETIHLAGAPTLAAAAGAPWILATPGTLCHTATLHLCRSAGFEPRARHHADDFATVLALVAAGQGVSVVPHLATAGAPPGVTLTPLPARRRTRIAYRRGTAGHPAVAACVTALQAAAAAYLPQDRP